MRKIILFIALILVTSNAVKSQFLHFVELRDSTIIRGKVKLSNNLFKGRRLIVNDTTEIKLSNVRAYQISDGYFLRVNKGYGDDFAERIKKGNIDLYSRPVTGFSGPTSIPGAGGSSVFIGGGFSNSSIQYFSKNGGDLQKASPANLKKALADNEVSMKFLNDRDGLTTLQVLGAVAGVAIVATTLAPQLDKDELNLVGPVIGIAVFAGGIWLPEFKKRELTLSAIDAYNNPWFYDNE
tara:strand:- start:21510 stop:22223 length:714 start_codon:yes stop_codon:yes gene_type:complete